MDTISVLYTPWRFTLGSLRLPSFNRRHRTAHASLDWSIKGLITVCVDGDALAVHVEAEVPCKSRKVPPPSVRIVFRRVGLMDSFLFVHHHHRLLAQSWVRYAVARADGGRPGKLPRVDRLMLPCPSLIDLPTGGQRRNGCNTLEILIFFCSIIIS